jgi:citrate lyase subunit beta/citryl-CoA lyase
MMESPTHPAGSERTSLTYLFVPAHDGAKVTRALASEADAVILDLEDGVPADHKAAARALIRERVKDAPAANRPRIWIRVNASGRELAADLPAIDWASVEGAIVPKAERPDVLREVRAAGAKQLIPLVETVAGFSALPQLAGEDGVARFAIGTLDLACDLSLPVEDPDDAELIWQLRGTLAIDSRRLGLAPPIDGVYTRLDDDAGLRAVSERARRLGYTGKLLLHPRQIVIVRTAFTPRPAELQWAQEIVDAFERALVNGRGAIQVRGRMVDEPVVARARALLARRPIAG